MKMRFPWLTLVGVLAAGCSDSSDEPVAIQERLALQSFGSCNELERYIEDTATADMRRQIDDILNGSVFGGPVRGGAEGAPAADSAGGKSGPSAYTTTNTQVAGVDEADFVKNDGNRIFVLSGQTLFASRSWPAQDTQLAGKLDIEGYPSQMFLKDDQVVVFSSIYTYQANGGGGGAPVADCAGLRCGGYGQSTTKITVVDVSNLAAPRVKREFYLPGSYSNSRRVGSAVRLVLSDSFRWPDKIRFYPDYSAGLWEDKERLRAALEQLKTDNEKLIRDQTLDQWLPPSSFRDDDGKVVPVAYSCSDFHKNNAPVRLGLLTIATLNLDNPRQAPTRTSIVAEPGEIFASQGALYVASRHWWWRPAVGQLDYTYLHKFDITDPNRARYVASGGVDGYIVDQFSMDESNGFFRVATTISRRVPDLMNPQNIWGRVETSNRVTVLGERSGALRTIGKSEELAKGERIYSARFLGNRGFLVTFRQVDPFYTFDLSNPANPQQIGELKIPGFSTYLHPVDENHVMGLGVYMPEPDANGQVDWRKRRMKLSMFDVSDFKNPKEKFNYLIGTANGWSEAAYEHKAFNYFAQKGLLAIPFSDWLPSGETGDYWGNFVSELRVFNVDVDKGITSRGAISMRDVYMQEGDRGWAWYWSPWVRRSVMADDYVYAISDAGIRVATVGNLNQTLATVRFGKRVVK